MALPSSGEITFADIYSEYNNGSAPGANQDISLGTLSTNVTDGGTNPDAISEFYGLSAPAAAVYYTSNTTAPTAITFDQVATTSTNFEFGHWPLDGNSFNARMYNYTYAVQQYKFSTQYDVTSITSIINPNDYYSQTNSGGRGVVFTTDGLIMLICANVDDKWWYANSGNNNPYEPPSGANLTSIGNMQSLFGNNVWRNIFNWYWEKGGKYLIWHAGGTKVCKFTMPSGYEGDPSAIVSQGSLNIVDLGNINGAGNNVQSVFACQGNILLIYDDAGSRFKVYSCSTPYDASNITFVRNLNFPTQMNSAGFNASDSYSFKLINNYIFVAKRNSRKLIRLSVTF